MNRRMFGNILVAAQTTAMDATSTTSTAPTYVPWTKESGENQMMPIMVATLMSCFGLGILMSVAWSYHVNYPRDSRFNKIFVAVIVILSLGDTLCTSIRVCRLTGPYAGNYAPYLDMVHFPEAWLGGVLAMLTESVCELFMIIRVVRFARALRRTYGARIKLFVNAFTVFLGVAWLWDVFVGLSPAILLAVMGNILNVTEGSKPTQLFHFFLNAQISTFMILDFIVTASLFAELRLAKSGFAGSNTVLNRLSVIGLQTGLLVLLIQTGELMASYLSPTAWFDVPILVLGKVRALTVIAVIVAPRRAHEAYFTDQETRSRPSGDIVRPSVASLGPKDGGISPGGGGGGVGMMRTHGTTTGNGSQHPLMHSSTQGASSSGGSMSTTPKDSEGVLHVSYSPSPPHMHHDGEDLDEKDAMGMGYDEFGQRHQQQRQQRMELPVPPLPAGGGIGGISGVGATVAAWAAGRGGGRKASAISMSLEEMLSSAPGDDEEMMRDIRRKGSNY